MRVRVRVPATTANLGPGFDCLGLALSMCNEVEFHVEGVAGTGQTTSSKGNRVVRVTSEGRPYRSVPLSKNLVYRSFSHAISLLGITVSSVNIDVLRTEIPIARGLGSSAASITAGVLAAREVSRGLGRSSISPDEAIDIAVEIEGHPDNVVPAMVGGMTVAALTGESGRRTVYSRVPVPESLVFAALVPGFRVSTEDARKVLPENYSRADAVFNVGRAALLIASLAAGDLSALRTATADKLHQPYRLALIPHSAEVIRAAREAGSIAEFLSGSGPTIMAVVEGDGADFARRISSRVAGISGKWAVHLLRPDHGGAEVEAI